MRLDNHLLDLTAPEKLLLKKGSQTQIHKSQGGRVAKSVHVGPQKFVKQSKNKKNVAKHINNNKNRELKMIQGQNSPQ